MKDQRTDNRTDTDKKIRNAAIPTLLLMPAIQAQAQDDDGFFVKSNRSDLEEMLDDDNYGPSDTLLSYSTEIVLVVIVAVSILMTHNSVSKRYRNGCTFFIVVFAILIYFINGNIFRLLPF